MFILCIVDFILSVMCSKAYDFSLNYKETMPLLILSNGHEAVQRSKTFISTSDRDTLKCLVELWNHYLVTFCAESDFCLVRELLVLRLKCSVATDYGMLHADTVAA